MDTAVVCPVAPAPVYPAPLDHDGSMTELNNPWGIATATIDGGGSAYGVAQHVAMVIHRLADK